MSSTADALATTSHVDDSTSPSQLSIKTAAANNVDGAAHELNTQATSTASHIGNSTPPSSSVIDSAAIVQDQPPSTDQRPSRSPDNDKDSKLAREADDTQNKDYVDE
jgi:hypothetical protein